MEEKEKPVKHKIVSKHTKYFRVEKDCKMHRHVQRVKLN